MAVTSTRHFSLNKMQLGSLSYLHPKMFMDLWIILELVTLYSGQSSAAVENELQNKNTQVTCKKKVWI